MSIHWMKTKLVISLFLYSISVTVFAQQIQSSIVKLDGHVTSSQKKLITNTLLYINKVWADKGKSMSRNITEQYFDSDTTLVINGKRVYKGYDQLESHFRQVGKYIRGKICFPLLEVIGIDNELIVHFNEDIYDNHGNYYPANVIAIFTLHNGKIKKWDEVANSKYFCQAESTSVVFNNN